MYLYITYICLLHQYHHHYKKNEDKISLLHAPQFKKNHIDLLERIQSSNSSLILISNITEK